MTRSPQERRLEFLNRVQRLAKSLNIAGEHWYTCETAGYFYNYYIVPIIKKYNASIKSGKGVERLEVIKTEFPFSKYSCEAFTER